MNRCPKCKGLNVHSFEHTEAHHCRDCHHAWGEGWEKRMQLSKDLDSSFKNLFGENYNG